MWRLEFVSFLPSFLVLFAYDYVQYILGLIYLITICVFFGLLCNTIRFFFFFFLESLTNEIALLFNLYSVIGQLTIDDGGDGDFVMMEDPDSDSFVAIGEILESNFTPSRFLDSSMSVGERIVRVVLKSVVFPEAKLTYEVVDPNGKVVCRTLGEAYKRQLGILWLERNIAITEADGCTYNS
jgi:hypothetical protein